MTDLEVQIVDSGAQGAQIVDDGARGAHRIQNFLTHPTVLKNILILVFAAVLTLLVNIGMDEFYEMPRSDVRWASLIVSIATSLSLMVCKLKFTVPIIMCMNHVITLLVLYFGIVPISFPSLWIFPISTFPTSFVGILFDHRE